MKKKNHHLRDKHLEQHVERIELAIDEIFDPFARVTRALKRLRLQSPPEPVSQRAA